MSSCSKAPYPTQAAARTALAAIREKRAGDGSRQPIRVYPCDRCDGWHLTAKSSGKRVPPWDRDPNWQRTGL